MGNPFQGHIETVLVIEAMPADGSDLTVCADQKLDVAHVLGEAHILEDEHVLHQPVLLEEVALGAAVLGQSRLLSHGGKEELQGRTQGMPAEHPSHQHPIHRGSRGALTARHAVLSGYRRGCGCSSVVGALILERLKKEL